MIHISIWFQNEDCIASGPGKDMFDSTRIIAEKQYNKGKVHFIHVITVIVHFTYSMHLHCVHYLVLYTCTMYILYYILVHTITYNYILLHTITYSTCQMQLQLQTRFARSVNVSANIFTCV